MVRIAVSAFVMRIARWEDGELCGCVRSGRRGLTFCLVGGWCEGERVRGNLVMRGCEMEGKRESATKLEKYNSKKKMVVDPNHLHTRNKTASFQIARRKHLSNYQLDVNRMEQRWKKVYTFLQMRRNE